MATGRGGPGSGSVERDGVQTSQTPAELVKIDSSPGPSPWAFEARSGEGDTSVHGPSGPAQRATPTA